VTAVSLAVVIVLSLPFLVVLLRRPVLRRLAVRNALRRPREASLVVLGSLLGAAIITGSAIVGDTIDASIRQAARTHLGPVDELVAARGPADQHQLLRVLQPIATGNVDGILPLATLDAATTSTGRDVLAVPRTQVIGVDFGAARRFGGDVRDTGMSGPTPTAGHAAITADLARALDVRAGGEVAVFAYGRRTLLSVDRILPRRGIAGFWLGPEQEAENVLVGPATFDDIARGLGPGAPPSWPIAISNRGGVESGVGRTDAVIDAIHNVAPAPPLDPQIYAAKRTLLDEADAVGNAFGSMFTAMGSFGVLAGLLLLVNLFVMLAAERKTEMGMARAVGMRRSDLVRSFATEGWMYAIVAAALGVLVGIALGRVLVAWSAAAFTTEHNRLELFFTLKPSGLAQSFAIAFAVSLLTIVGTSWRVAKLNIIRAIRDVPEPPARGHRRRSVVAGAIVAALGVVVTLQSAPSRNGFGLLLGPVLILGGSAPILSRFLPARHVHTALSLLAVAWGASLFALVPDATKGASVMLYVVQGVVLTAAAVVFVSLQQPLISGGLRSITGGRSLALRLGLAYPLARRSRTGLTIAMYALVVFILTFITSLSHMIDREVTTATRSVKGGYAVVVRSSSANPIHAARLASLDGVTKVAPLASTTAQFRVEGMTTSVPWSMTGFDRRFVAGGAPVLDDRGSYPTDRAAWEAVLRNPRLVIVDSQFLQNGGGGPPGFVVEPGSKVVAKDPYTGKARVLTVAAIAPGDFFINNGALYGLAGARSLFGYELALNRAYVGLKPTVDADRFAAGVQSRFLSNGAEAFSIATIVDEGFSITHQIFQLFQGYLAMGLIVGIAGIAVVMVRAVRERRRQIGTLRALGFGARPVGRSFAIESGFVAIEGTLIGSLLALITLYDIVALSDSFGSLGFSVPFLELGVLLTGTVLASLLATVWPAISASRIRPAVALRITD
jgi:putative ABC transport system permease protein